MANNGNRRIQFGRTKRQSTFDEKELETIVLSDFTPGIWDDYYSAGGQGQFPEGAAQRTNTYGCVVSKDGSLIPGPKLIHQYIEQQFDTNTQLYPSSDRYTHITAFKNVPTVNDYPNLQFTQVYPTSDKSNTSFLTNPGNSSSNLFSILATTPLNTGQSINDRSANGNGEYSTNFSLSSYTTGSRNVSYVQLTVAFHGGFISGGQEIGLNIGGTLYQTDTASSIISGTALINTYIFFTNPATNLPWTQADIRLFASTSSFEILGTNTGSVTGNLYYQVFLTIIANNDNETGFTDQAFYSFQWWQYSSLNPLALFQKTKVRSYGYMTSPVHTYDLSNITTSNFIFLPSTLNYGYTSLDLSRANISAPTSPGNPLIASLVNPWLDNSVYSALVYPSGSTPTIDSTDTLTITGTNALRLCAHQDRIIAIVNSGISAFGSIGTIGYEELRATATNDYSNDSGMDSIFVNENPSNIGAMISMNASELIVIKDVGGGYLARGDVANSPTIVRLPGIPGADINHNPVTIPGGVIYGNSQGLWQFSGGNTAAHISPQLDGRFWIPNQTQNYLGARGSFAYIYPYVFLPNGFIYDMKFKSYWKLNYSNNYAWASQTSEGYALLAPSYFKSGDSIADWYDIHQGQSYYSWQSHPLPITQTRLMQAEELTLIAQPYSASVGGTITITLTGVINSAGQATQQEIFTLAPSNRPIAYTIPTMMQGYDMTVRIESASSDKTSPAPRLYQLSIGVSEQTQARG